MFGIGKIREQVEGFMDKLEPKDPIDKIEQDIKVISEKVGTAVFSYEEIHNENVDNRFHHNYQKVIDEVSRVKGRDMKEELIEMGVLKPLAYGEYAVEVGSSTRCGGGTNFWGNLFFSFKKEDNLTRYHELAHSLQWHYNLFDDKTIDKLYQQSSTGDAKLDEEKLAKREDYRHYLREMHSESFAYAAMMLRAENRLDFARQTLNTFEAGYNSNIYALFAPGKDYPSQKYYATYPIMQETIKQIWKIHKQNKTGDFFDENGILKDEKLAKLTEDIVVKNAYSPRTFNSMLNYDVLDEHSAKEHGWRGDMLKSGVQKLSLLALSVPWVLNSKFSKELYEHDKLYQKENQEIQNFLNTDTTSMKPDLALLTDFAKLQIRYNNIGEKTINDIVKQNVQKILPVGYIPENAQKKLVSDLCYFAQNGLEYSNEKDLELKENLTTFFDEAGKFAEKYHLHPHFAELLTKINSYDDVWKMIDAQTKDTKANVWDTGKQNSQNTEKNFGFASFSVVSQINYFNEFSDKYDKSGVLKNELISTYTQTPEKLLDENYQQQVMQKFMPQEKQAEFKEQAELMFGAVWCVHIIDRENPQYIELLQKMSMVPTNEVYDNVIQILESDRKSATANRVADERLREKEGKTAEAQVQNEEKQDIKTPKEKVAGRLKSWGIEDGSYMLLTREDHARVGYGNDDFQSVDSYFEHGQKEVQQSGKDVVYGRNNGIYGAYFDEGVYVLSTNDKMGEALYRMGEDVGLGVMLSNAEKFESYALKANWERVKDNGNKINVEMENQRTTQKRNLAFNQVQSMMNEIGQTADKHDASGRLKADLEKAYLQSEDKMLSLEFWGEVAQKYALNSPTGKEACLKDIGALGLKLGKDIKQNQNNEYYSAAKKSLTDEKSHPKEGKNNVMVAMQMRNNVTLR